MNRPEERVRLKWVEYLLHEAEWNRNRIGFESPVTVQQSENKKRADLILYSEEMKPNILIECKSEKVALTEKEGEQIARYNTDLSAPYLILTNGVVDLNYEIREGKAQEITHLFLTESARVKRDSLYWAKRGFGGFNMDSDDVEWPFFLEKFWSDSLNSVIRYLSFQSTHIPIPIDHYYRIFQIDKETKLAISTVGHGESETFLIAVLNQKGINREIIYLNVDQWVENSSEAVIKVNEKGVEKGPMKTELKEFFLKGEHSDMTNFSKNVMKLF